MDIEKNPLPSGGWAPLRAAAGVDAADYITERPVIAGVHLVRALGELEDEPLGILLVAGLWRFAYRKAPSPWGYQVEVVRRAHVHVQVLGGATTLFEYCSQQLPAARPTAPTSLEPSDETKSPTHGRDNRQAPAVQQYVTSSIVSCETTDPETRRRVQGGNRGGRRCADRRRCRRH